MGEVHIKLVDDQTPETVEDLISYLREMICVDEQGMRRMPNYVDDEVCNAAADLIEKLLANPTPATREAGSE
ncbi:hypothetical protein EQW76_00515 [Rhizobium sp. rho-13.1]|uniref:hypothetical protein n=1 Tax=Rhizobium sp. rho-13.1 TaxID=2506431 RepID=UPI00115D918F|nr:hypothetical protein [Rhizobium sp. rho-13.1]TQX91258.1 hypothetical protein EQW76_00515 [Rhizobium sp. rho-13.1]